MNIIVPVKTNVDTEMVRIKNREPVLEGVPYKLGDLDKNALEAALQLAAEVGDSKVIAVTVNEGNRKIKDTIKEALAMGADEAYIIDDPAALAADQAGIAKIIAKAVEKIGDYDLVIFAEGSTDKYSGQVGPRVAEQLGLPEIGYARKIVAGGAGVQVDRGMGDFIETWETTLPAVVTVTSEINEPRVCTLMNIMKAGKKPQTDWTLADLDLDADTVASRNTLISNLAEEQARKNVVFEGTIEEQVDKLIDALIKEGVLEA